MLLILLSDRSTFFRAYGNIMNTRESFKAVILFQSHDDHRVFDEVKYLDDITFFNRQRMEDSRILWHSGKSMVKEFCSIFSFFPLLNSLMSKPMINIIEKLFSNSKI